MNYRWVNISRAGKTGKTGILIASVLALSVQLVPHQAVIASAKKPAQMSVPINEKLEELGKLSTDTFGKETAKPDLTPVKLSTDSSSGGGASGATQTTASASSAVLKSTVSETDFVPKGPVGTPGISAPPISINTADTLEEKVRKDAKKTNIMPLALMESRDEADRKQEARFDAEKEELTDLWNATLTRSPDIQFVSQKLLPSSNPGHTTAVMMKGLQSVMFGAAGAAAIISPTPATMMTANMGAQMINQVLGMGAGRAEKAARLSQTESIMLYTIVRTTADKLVDNFRNYKKTIINLKVAENDMVDLQSMVKNMPAMSPKDQLETNYTLRKQQRDIAAITEDARRHRQSLSDLAGGDAVAKLDQQIDQEQQAIDPQLIDAQKRTTDSDAQSAADPSVSTAGDSTAAAPNPTDGTSTAAAPAPAQDAKTASTPANPM